MLSIFSLGYLSIVVLSALQNNCVCSFLYYTQHFINIPSFIVSFLKNIYTRFIKNIIINPKQPGRQHFMLIEFCRVHISVGVQLLQLYPDTSPPRLWVLFSRVIRNQNFQSVSSTEDGALSSQSKLAVISLSLVNSSTHLAFIIHDIHENRELLSGCRLCQRCRLSLLNSNALSVCHWDW